MRFPEVIWKHIMRKLDETVHREKMTNVMKELVEKTTILENVQCIHETGLSTCDVMTNIGRYIFNSGNFVYKQVDVPCIVAIQSLNGYWQVHDFSSDFSYRITNIGTSEITYTTNGDPKCNACRYFW